MNSLKQNSSMPFLAAMLWIVFALSSFTFAAQKTIVLEETTDYNYRLTVSPDGSKIIVAGSAYFIFTDDGKLVDKVRTEQGSSTRDLMPLPDNYDPLIKYYSCTSYAGGHLAPCRADGSEIKTIVTKGSAENQFHADSTGWTNPLGAALDYQNKLIFAIESSAPAENEPNPAWSRIVVFDLDGKLQRSINFFNCKAAEGSPERDDTRRAWYKDVAVDPKLKHVYAISQTQRALLAFDYQGKALGSSQEIPFGDSSGIAVLPDSRIAIGSGSRIAILDPTTLKTVSTVEVPKEITQFGYGVLDLEADEKGHLYAIVNDPSVNFLRWSTDFKTVETYGPKFLRMLVDMPTLAFVAGTPFKIKASVSGRPQPPQPWQWQVIVRPSDGSDLRWQQLPVSIEADTITVTPPKTMRGVFELAVRYGSGSISLADRANDPSMQWQAIFVPPTANRSLTIFTTSSRQSFRQGEAIAMQLLRREAPGGAPVLKVNCMLAQNGKEIASVAVNITDNTALTIPATISRRLMPGQYTLTPVLADYECYALPFTISASFVDSPLQRVLYHEFGNSALNGAGGADNAERLALISATVSAVSRLGFTRETDRLFPASGGQSWRRDQPYANQSNLAFPPAEYFSLSLYQSLPDYFLDQSVRNSTVYDTQMLSHCAAVQVRDERIADFLPKLYNTAQWASRYPSFYGFNYNDEMFFWTNYDGRWGQADTDYMNTVIKDQFKGNKPDAYKWALKKMYDGFNNVVTRATPTLARTTTPMWQFPAMEGSYAPTIYENMTESYSHFLSEGYSLPFVPAHSAEMLRRPGLPLIGIADSGYATIGADLYQKTTMQLLVRGMQGVGISHTTAFQDPSGAQSFTNTNQLAKMYGAIFAESTRVDEAAVLYSYSQDVTENRAGMGTPHWERVYGLFSAGLMAGVPTRILYEEDITAGYLLDGRTPRVPMLFLVGQKNDLPAPVMRAIDAFRAAGGKLFIDAQSKDIPNAIKLPFDTRVDTGVGYASDTAFPLMQPVLESIAAQLRPAVEQYLRFPIATDDPWVAKGLFKGGNARYIMLATETSPVPWETGAFWGMGAMYCKNSHTWLPKSASLTLPAGGIIYNVFDHSVVKANIAGKMASIPVDLTTMPGRLYAILPAQPGTPRLSIAVQGDTLHYQIDLLDSTGKALAIQAPLRLRLISGNNVGEEFYRGSNSSGILKGSVAMPINGNWSLQVTELISAKTVIAPLPPLAAAAVTNVLLERKDIDIQRETQILRMLADAEKQGQIYFCANKDLALPQAEVDALGDVLANRGIKLLITPFPEAKKAQPGIYITVGVNESDALLGDMINTAWQRNLLDFPRSPSVPGAGRGYITAIFSARQFNEDCIMLLAGDTSSIAKTIVAFINLLRQPQPITAPVVTPKLFVTGKADNEATVSTLSDMFGVKLTDIVVAADGKHLAISAGDYMKNIALVSDEGTEGKIIRSSRVGQAPTTNSLFVSSNGSSFGAAGRTTERFGQAFYLTDSTSGNQQVFAGFGDLGRNINRFAASVDGKTVVTSGTYGVAGWQLVDGNWQEQWSYDYWKEFQQLDWPISDLAERAPQFNALIPNGANYALITFGEFSPNGWVTPVNTCSSKIIALDLRDGKVRWTFDVPIMKTLLFPTLYSSPSGNNIVLKVQMGSWGKETFRFFSIDTQTGKLLAQWDSKVEPLSISVADGNGAISEAYSDRSITIRDQDGTLRYNNYWPDNIPTSIAFTTAGDALYVADDAARLTLIDLQGNTRWSINMGSLSTLAAAKNCIYAAGWDGRLRSFNAEDGKMRWVVDCTPALHVDNPMPVLAKSIVPPANLHQSQRLANSSAQVPTGENLLSNGKATLKVGGTKGWMSGGAVQIKAEELTDGKNEEVSNAWMSLNELFWNGQSGRQVWAQIDFPAPTDISSVTVYESVAHPESWPTDALIQVWDEEHQIWKTATYGIFLNGRINTYTLNLKKVSKLRYAPWSSYYRNFYTTEIDVRG